MIHLNDCARSRGNFKPFQIYTLEKKEHMHLLRWVLTLLALHHFLLQLLLASLVWAQFLCLTPPPIFSPLTGEEGGFCLPAELAFLSVILDCRSSSPGAPHASVCYERR